MPVILPGPDVARASRPCLPEEKKNMGETPMPRMPTRRFVRLGPPPTQPLPEPVVEKPKREKKPKVKNDPKHIAAARELRDRWLEQSMPIRRCLRRNANMRCLGS